MSAKLNLLGMRGGNPSSTTPGTGTAAHRAHRPSASPRVSAHPTCHTTSESVASSAQSAQVSTTWVDLIITGHSVQAPSFDATWSNRGPSGLRTLSPCIIRARAEQPLVKCTEGQPRQGAFGARDKQVDTSDVDPGFHHRRPHVFIGAHKYILGFIHPLDQVTRFHVCPISITASHG